MIKWNDSRRGINTLLVANRGGGEEERKKKTDDRLKLRLGNDIARALIERLHCSNVAVASCVIL